MAKLKLYVPLWSDANVVEDYYFVVTSRLIIIIFYSSVSIRVDVGRVP